MSDGPRLATQLEDDLPVHHLTRSSESELVVHAKRWRIVRGRGRDEPPDPVLGRRPVHEGACGLRRVPLTAMIRKDGPSELDGVGCPNVVRAGWSVKVHEADHPARLTKDDRAQ